MAVSGVKDTADPMKAPYPLPQPAEVSSGERGSATSAYLMMFAAAYAGLPLPIVNLIAAIVYYLTQYKKSRFVGFHCFQSLITQVPLSILNMVTLAYVISFVLIDSMHESKLFVAILAVGCALTLLANIVYSIFSIVAAYQANKGGIYYIPLFGKWAYDRFYGHDAMDEETFQAHHTPIVNEPPTT
ncbi:MAG: hypothetical protein DRI90_13530 [Deltaproteobacteria bacterium]|nr:MAG: hypothetical protein DRI90_13530 [Deltaproteobacteria bacterium]